LIPRIRGIWRRRSILNTLVERDLRVRYSNSVLGWVWSVLDPLLMAAVYFVVFTTVFTAHRVAEQPYFLYLLSGMLGWQWFTASVTDTTRSLITEAKLVRSTNLPREIWVIRCVVSKGVEYVLSLPVLVGFVIFYVIRGDAHVDWRLIFFPLGFALQFLLLVGIGLILAPITVLVTDMERVVRIFLRFFFYLTPVLYATKSVPGPLRDILIVNPLNGILSLYRAGLFDQPVAWPQVAVSAAMSVVLLVLGFWAFARLERAVLKEI
jgi:ABC-2 type transport system permease protein